MTWRTVALRDVVELQRGYDLPQQERRPGSVPIVGSAGPNGSHDEANVRAPGVVVGRSGAGFGSAHYCEVDFWALNTGLYVKDFRNNHPKFIFYLLDHLDFSKYNSGGAQASLNRNFIYPILVRLPSEDEQEQIASMLNEWETAIQKNEKLIAAKGRHFGATSHLLLTARRRVNGATAPWQLRRADDMFVSASSKGHITEALLSVTQEHGVIPRGLLEGRVTMPSGDTGSFKLVEPGDFVISLRSFEGGLEHSNYRGVVSPAYTVLKATAEIDKRFFRHYFKSADFIKRLSVAVIGIRDGKQISFQDFCSIKLPFPPLDEQKVIAAILDDAEREVGLLRKYRDALHHQKRGLMQKLLTGQWRLPLPEQEAV
jgi:type I restriction enzyme S subunit